MAGDNYLPALSSIFDRAFERYLRYTPSGRADLVLRHSSVWWRHWRTMAFLASRLMGLRKADGLLVRVGELCGIVRASYLSPFFPFTLGLE